jgi:DNA-binding beta-propeller fold protein YncE
MTKRHLIFIILVALTVLSGCTTSSGPAQNAPKKTTDQLAFPPPPDEPRYYFERVIRGNLDVLPEEDKSSSLRRALTGEDRKAVGFVKPYAIAARHGKIYVGDAPRRVVMVFDIPGQKYFTIGEEPDEDGKGKIQRPMGLDIDKQGNLYVLDANQKMIMVFSEDGKFLRSFGDPSMLYKPAGLAVTPDGSRVYAVDIGGSSSNEHKIVVFNGITGEHLEDLGKRGSGPGEFNLPRDVTIAPDGTIYVIDGGNFRVQKFDKNGKFLTTFGTIGRNPGQFSRPKEGAVDPSGNLYVVDTAFGNFQIFNAKDQLLMAIGSRGNVNGPGVYSLPAGIAVDDDGRIYVVDQYFRKVDVFRPADLAEDGGWIGKFNKKKTVVIPTASVAEDAKATAPSGQELLPDAQLTLPTENQESSTK